MTTRTLRNLITKPRLKPASSPRVPLRRIVGLFRPYRWSLAFVGLLVGASALFSLVNPFLIRAVIDVALPQRRLGLLAVLAIGMIAVAVANSSISVSQTFVSTKVGQRLTSVQRRAASGTGAWRSPTDW